jgi:asparagine N-glycosylation enzyme membrane subunit Stt3
MWEFLDPFLKTLETGTGFWNPLVWATALVIAFLLMYILRGFGNKQFKVGTEQTKAFLSGNPEYEKQQMHITGSNVYWGFTESLGWLFNQLKKMHTGNVSDYVLWFVIVLAVLFIVVGGI